MPARSRPVSKITDPAEKKALTYREDHRYPAEYPHSFRKTFPRHKARANRKYRRQVRQYVETHATEPLEQSPLPVQREIVTKWTVMPLGEWIVRQRRRRIRRTAHNYFKSTYDPAIHQQRFAVFLSSMTGISAHSADAREYARYFRDLLDPLDLREPMLATVHRTNRERLWLATFLRDRPEWGPRRRDWIDRVDTSQSADGQ